MKIAGKTATFALALVMAGAAVQAEAPEKRGGEPMTKAQVLEKAAARFDAADTDGDGMLTREELRAGARKMRDRATGKGPEGREGREGRGPRDGAKLFERLDADGNGSLSKEEFLKMMEMGRKHRGGPRDQ